MSLESKSIPLETEHDIAVARSQVRLMAEALGFRMLDQTRLATVTSELARNVVKYARRGRLIAQPTNEERTGRGGLRLIFEDDGPGIPNLDSAMSEGFTTGRGLGQGLPGSRRLVDEFHIESEMGRGTRVTIVRWIT
ncbi:MAG TPA: anti-sigma regulatory factor [Pyrinomonadaceae bacterium]|jgi:serine/threonine-protein kinase RsbT